MIGRRGWVVTGAVVLVVAVGLAVLVTRHRATNDSADAPVPTVFMGDSLTQADTSSFDARPGPGSWVGYALGDGSPWEYAADVAVGGQTLAQMSARFQSDVLDRDPAGVVIMGGTNDVLQGLPVDLSVADLTDMVRAARAAGARVWVVAPPGINALYLKPVGPMVGAQRSAAEEAGATFVDVGDDDRLFDQTTGDWLPGLSFDGVHPTPAGAEALAGVILDRLDG